MLLVAIPALALATTLGAAPAAADADADERASLAAELGYDLDAAPPPAPSEAPAARPCPARDPENGRCYPSADAADIAWLSRAPSAAVSLLEESDEEGEEGAPAGFWRSLGDRLRSLVVRRSDGKPVAVPEEEIAALFATTFPLPVSAYDRSRLRDTFLSRRGKHKKHFAIDLGAPRGTPVLAVADGTIERLGRDRRGGKVVYLRDVTGRYTFYYAHLRVHAKGLAAGQTVRKGQPLGEVGATGRVIGGPHLHFAIFRNADPAGTRVFAVNPYLIFSAFPAR